MERPHNKLPARDHLTSSLVLTASCGNEEREVGKKNTHTGGP